MFGAKDAENFVLAFLEKKGYSLLAKNFYSRYGEIDLIVENAKREEVIFVEVKSRQAKDIDMAKHSVCKKKQRRIIITSQVYLQTMEPNAKYFRFDVIVLCKSSRRIKWYKNAFDVS